MLSNLQSRIALLIRQPGKLIQRLQGRAQIKVLAKGSRIYLDDLARTVDTAERAIDRQAEIGVAAAQSKRIRLHRQRLVGHPQPLWRVALRREIHQYRAIGKIGNDITAVEHAETIGMRVDRNDLSRLQGAAYRRFGRCPRENADLLSSQRVEAAGPIIADHQSRAIRKGRD